MKILIIAALVGVALGSDYTPGPSYHTTQVLGPFANARVAGAGQRSASSSYERQGSAAGADYATDQAQAAETAAKARGYDYAIRRGFSYYQPNLLYAYSFERPLIGTRDLEYYIPNIDTNIGLAPVAVHDVVYPGLPNIDIQPNIREIHGDRSAY